MLAGITVGCRTVEPRLLSVSGLDELIPALDGLEADGAPVFVEVLACRGGCINGPGMGAHGGTLMRRRHVIAAAQGDGLERPRPPAWDIASTWPAVPVARAAVDDARLRQALAQVGKTGEADEFNCGGCGYETCREFATALALGRAERDMCVAWTRRLAQSKAAALLRALPAAAMLVDDAGRIVEANAAFAGLLSPTLAARFAADGRLPQDAAVPAPLAARLRHVLDGGAAHDTDLRLGERILAASVFVVEPARMAGAVLSDITAPAVARAQIAARAQQVIDRHLETVQRIAYLLGENAAETEGVLQSLVDAHRPGAAPA